MTDVWHIPNFIPDPFKAHPIIVIYEAGGEIEQMMSNEYRTRVGDRYVNRWCYVDDLLNCEKALEIAVDMLKEIDKTRSVANHKIGTPDKTLNAGIMFCWATPDQIHNALTEITALMQGGKNE